MKEHELQRLTKDELIKELESLRAVEQEYRELLDESSDPIFAFRPNGEYRYVNQAFATGVGRQRADILGKNIKDIFPVEEAQKRFATVKWVFENRQSKIIEVRVPRLDGDRYFVTTAKPIFDTAGAVVTVICISKDITERKLMEEKLARLAQYDSLTELPNRMLFADCFQQALSAALRENTHLALMYVDLDNFKTVNDTYGHSAGDTLLQESARRLQSCIRGSDTVGRIGGDEFIVVLPGIPDARVALALAERIRLSMRQPFKLADNWCNLISASIGIAIYPDHGQDSATLSKSADDAMFEAKAKGRNRVQLFQANT